MARGTCMHRLHKTIKKCDLCVVLKFSGLVKRFRSQRNKMDFAKIGPVSSSVLLK